MALTPTTGLLAGLVGGGVAGFFLSRYLVTPAPVSISCGGSSITVSPAGVLTLPNGQVVNAGSLCMLAGLI
jgi:hypothetical protein